MATRPSPNFPPNYVTLKMLQERRLKEKQEAEQLRLKQEEEAAAAVAAEEKRRIELEKAAAEEEKERRIKLEKAAALLEKDKRRNRLKSNEEAKLPRSNGPTSKKPYNHHSNRRPRSERPPPPNRAAEMQKEGRGLGRRPPVSESMAGYPIPARDFVERKGEISISNANSVISVNEDLQEPMESMVKKKKKKKKNREKKKNNKKSTDGEADKKESNEVLDPKPSPENPPARTRGNRRGFGSRRGYPRVSRVSGSEQDPVVEIADGEADKKESSEVFDPKPSPENPPARTKGNRRGFGTRRGYPRVSRVSGSEQDPVVEIADGEADKKESNEVLDPKPSPENPPARTRGNRRGFGSRRGYPRVSMVSGSEQDPVVEIVSRFGDLKFRGENEAHAVKVEGNMDPRRRSTARVGNQRNLRPEWFSDFSWRGRIRGSPRSCMAWVEKTTIS